VGARLRERGLHPLAPDRVGALELVGEPFGFPAIVGREQGRRDRRVTDAAHRVDPWREPEGDVVDAERGTLAGRAVQAGTDDERGEPGACPGREPREAQPDETAVLAHERHDVRHRPDRREVRERECGLRSARPRAQEELRDLERDARPGQARIGVAAVGPLRVHEREGLWAFAREDVMVGDDDVDARRGRLGDLNRAARPGVRRHDQAVTTLARPLDGRAREPVAFRRAVRHVGIDLQPEPGEGLAEDREPAQPVGVEVAQDEHALARRDRLLDAVDDELRVREERRVMETLLGRVEARAEIGWLHGPAARQDAHRTRRETAPARLRDGGLRDRMGCGDDPVMVRRQH
jgi:hypothetical protein